MPDTYKTFLSPGSCQLEVTDLVASANDDKGVDLYGVAWEIEQVLIAGEGFAASPTDVWVNERGILNVGQSLFDKINRTAEDNDNIPGQCTVVVKATSLVDSSKVARLKVLVGYPGEGGGGGGGGDFGAPVSVSFYDGKTIDESYVSEVRIPFGSEDYFTTNWDPDIIMGVPSGTGYWFITNTVVPPPGVPSGVKAFVVVIESQIEPVELQVVPDGENTYRVSVPKLEEIEGESYGLNIYVLTE